MTVTLSQSLQHLSNCTTQLNFNSIELVMILVYFVVINVILFFKCINCKKSTCTMRCLHYFARLSLSYNGEKVNCAWLTNLYSPLATRIYCNYYFPRKITLSLSHVSPCWEWHFPAFQAPPVIKKQLASAESITNIKVFDCNTLQVEK